MWIARLLEIFLYGILQQQLVETRVLLALQLELQTYIPHAVNSTNFNESLVII